MSARPQPRQAAAVAAAGASPLRDWLRSVGSWLAGPLRCRAFRLVWVPQVLDAAQWTDDLEALDASTLEADGEHVEGSGWLLPLDAGSSGVLCLFCASSLDPAQREAAAADLERGAEAARATWSLASPSTSRDAVVALVDRSEVRHQVHELRNALNSLMMNAATLTWRADAIPEPLRRFATQMQHDGERCAASLQQLQVLLDAPAPDEPREPARKPS